MLDGATRPETLFHNPLVKHFSRGAAVWRKFPLSPNRVHQNVTLLGRTPSSCFHVLFLSQQHNRRPANDHHIHAMSGKMWVVTHSDRLKQATQKWTGHYYRLIFLTTPLPSHSISKVPTYSHDTQNTKPVFAGGRVSCVPLNVPRVEPRIASFTYLLLARHALREEGLRWRLSN